MYTRHKLLQDKKIYRWSPPSSTPVHRRPHAGRPLPAGGKRY